MNKLISEVQRSQQATEIIAFVQKWWLLILLVILVVALLPRGSH